MTKKDTLQSIARKVTGDETLKCNTVRSALHCIAEEAKGEETSCKTINEALTCIDENIENLIGDRTAEAITITENGVTNTPSGKYYDPITVNVPSAADLEANKEVTITSNGTHEITPTEGKDGMEKATVTVNVSGGGVTKLYCFKADSGACIYTKKAKSELVAETDKAFVQSSSSALSEVVISIIGPGSIKITGDDNPYAYYSNGDIEL